MKKKNKKKKNTEIMRVTYLFTLLFLLLMGYYSYFVFRKAPDVVNSPYNPRQELLAKKVVRGRILAAGQEVLAETVMTTAGEVRSYPYGGMFAHVVGYSTKGKMGLEATNNFNLLTSNAFVGDRVMNSINEEKNPGDQIQTTLDVQIQEAAYQALGVYRGAVVVMEAKTGRILCIVSKPDFDPNEIDLIWDEIREDSGSGVLVNRATQGLYPPGSTFKIVTALEYIRENGTDYAYECGGRFTKDGDVIRCYHNQAHGHVDLTKAFSKSCNSAFADMGLKLNREAFQGFADTLLFNQELPLPFPYSKSSFKIDAGTANGEVMQAAIGQGQLLTTPMHMAMLTAAVANDGLLMKPYLVERVEDHQGNGVKSYGPEEYGRLFSEQEGQALREMMEAVIQNGTGTKLKEASYTAAGKTGSAEFSTAQKGESHAWFTGYAPAEEPEIVVTVVIEKAGSGGDYAVPTAKRLFDAYFN